VQQHASRREGETHLIAHSESRLYTGPLPPPEMLADYSNVIENGAERIFRQFEAQGDHRRELEMIVIRSENARAWAGIVIGSIVALGFVAGGVIIAIYGSPAWATAWSAAGIAGIVGAFIYGTRSRRQERTDKSNANP
jgi:uncharacterized membrane protein